MPKRKAAARIASGGLREREESSEDEEESKGKQAAKPAAPNIIVRHEGLTSNAALKVVCRWILAVHEKILQLAGYEMQKVEAMGDCGFLAFAAGHEITDANILLKPTVKQRMDLITKPLRKSAVELLATGKADDVQLLQPTELESVAKHLGFDGTKPISTSRAVRNKLKPWLTEKVSGLALSVPELCLC